MGRGRATLITIVVLAVNVFLAALVGLMMGGLPGMAGGVIVGLCVSAPMLPWAR